MSLDSSFGTNTGTLQRINDTYRYILSACLLASLGHDLLPTSYTYTRVVPEHVNTSTSPRQRNKKKG